MGYQSPRQTFGTALETLGMAKPSAAAKKRIAERTKAAKSAPIREKALAAMEKFVGLRENPAGSNHVPEINSWWGGGDVAWCARSVSKAYITAGSKAFVRGRKVPQQPDRHARSQAGRPRLLRLGRLELPNGREPRWDVQVRNQRALQDDRRQRRLVLRVPRPHRALGAARGLRARRQVAAKSSACAAP